MGVVSNIFFFKLRQNLPLKINKMITSVKIQFMEMRENLGKNGCKYHESQNIENCNRVKETFPKSCGEQQNLFTCHNLFRQCKQLPNKSAEEYLAKLSDLMVNCEYKSIISKEKFKEVELLQTLIAAISDEDARDQILRVESTKLTWGKACKIVQNCEEIKSIFKIFMEPEISVAEVQNPSEYQHSRYQKVEDQTSSKSKVSELQ